MAELCYVWNNYFLKLQQLFSRIYNLVQCQCLAVGSGNETVKAAGLVSAVTSFLLELINRKDHECLLMS